MEPKRVGIADLKAHLSEHLRDVRGGNPLLIVDRGTPVARVVPLSGGEDALLVREPSKPFAAFPFARKGRGRTHGVALLLEDRKAR